MSTGPASGSPWGTAARTKLYASRTIKHAEIVRAPTGNEAIAMFFRDKLDVLAGVKSPLLKFAKTRTDVRVMDGRFMVIEQAMGVPKGRDAGVRYLRAMIEELKSSGFVASGLKRRERAGYATTAASSPKGRAGFGWLTGTPAKTPAASSPKGGARLGADAYGVSPKGHPPWDEPAAGYSSVW